MPFRQRLWLIFIIALSTLLCGCVEEAEDMGDYARQPIAVTPGVSPYFVSFDDHSDWLVGNGAASAGQILAGEYHLSIEQAGSVAWTHNQTSYQYGVYSVETRLVSGPESSAYGMVLMADSEMKSFIYFMLTSDGRYDIGVCENQCEVMESFLDGYTSADLIRLSDQTNLLTVSVSVRSIIFSINGEPVQELMDFPVNAGVVGLIGESSPYYGFEAAFDNFHIIPEAVELSPSVD